MVIRSFGSWIWGFLVLLVNARAKERLPILPQYIRKIRIILEKEFRLLVIPVDIPEVPMAEHVSNSTSERGRF